MKIIVPIIFILAVASPVLAQNQVTSESSAAGSLGVIIPSSNSLSGSANPLATSVNANTNIYENSAMNTVGPVQCISPTLSLGISSINTGTGWSGYSSSSSNTGSLGFVGALVFPLPSQSLLACQRASEAFAVQQELQAYQLTVDTISGTVRACQELKDLDVPLEVINPFFSNQPDLLGVCQSIYAREEL